MVTLTNSAQQIGEAIVTYQTSRRTRHHRRRHWRCCASSPRPGEVTSIRDGTSSSCSTQTAESFACKASRKCWPTTSTSTRKPWPGRTSATPRGRRTRYHRPQSRSHSPERVTYLRVGLRRGDRTNRNRRRAIEAPTTTNPRTLKALPDQRAGIRLPDAHAATETEATATTGTAMTEMSAVEHRHCVTRRNRPRGAVFDLPAATARDGKTAAPTHAAKHTHSPT